MFVMTCNRKMVMPFLYWLAQNKKILGKAPLLGHRLPRKVTFF